MNVVTYIIICGAILWLTAFAYECGRDHER